VIQIISERRRPSFSEQLGKGLGDAASAFSRGYVEQAMKKENRRLQEEQFRQENDALKNLTGLDFEGIQDPNLRKQAMSMALQGLEKEKGFSRQQDLMREKYGLESSLQGEKYDAKTRAQLNLMKELGLIDEEAPIEQSFMPSKNPKGILKPEFEGEKNYSKNSSKLIPEDKITKMAMINPARARLMQKHNDNVLSQQRHEETLKQKSDIAGKKELSESYKENEPYINKVYDQYEDSMRRDAILSRMDQLDESGEMSESGMINLLESIGLKPEWLKNPANEEYTKLALDLLGGGALQADFGSRVLQSEFHVALQRIPTLMQTREGRRQIKENIRTMLMPARLKQERLQYYLDKAEREGKPLPHNLRGRILKDIKPQLEQIYDKFKQRNGRYKVKEGTYPDDDSIEKYSLLANGNEEKAIKMMKEDGYDVDE
jgi:hypothetical protein